MGKSIGIDLGTTNSVGAFKFVIDQDPEVVTAATNSVPERKLTRSMVAWLKEKPELVVGETAYNYLGSDPGNVITSIKRLMGRGFGEEAVATQKARVGYKIAAPRDGTENSLVVFFAGQPQREYRPEEISAAILKQVVANGQAALRERPGYRGDVIDQAVITIPAYFNDKQRSATRDAALLAGITPLELLAEPTAAAISYGFSPDSAEVKTILVYDYGGGTFDASVITCAGTQFLEQGKAGDLWLGGDDIDLQIVNYVKQKIAEEEGWENAAAVDQVITQMPFHDRVRFQADLRRAAEKAKIDLSTQTKVLVNPDSPLKEAGMIIPVQVELTRTRLEEMIAAQVQRTIQICHEAINISEYTPDLVDAVLLVGGSSQIPYVQQQVRAAFGSDKVVSHPRPMYAVAEGAAIVAAGMVDKTSTVSRDYFIQLADGSMEKVISKGDILPVRQQKTFRTVADDQRIVQLKFLSPDEVRSNLDQVTVEEEVGQLWLGLEDNHPAGTAVVVLLELDEQSSPLQITASLKQDPSSKVSCRFSRGQADEKVYRDLESFIDELNEEGRLTSFGAQKAAEMAAAVIKAASQIIDESGRERPDMLQKARDEYGKLEWELSDARIEAAFWARRTRNYLDLSDRLIGSPQQDRLRKLQTQLEAAQERRDWGGTEKLAQDVEREIDSLAPEAHLPVLCLEGIARVEGSDPARAQQLEFRFEQAMRAFNAGDAQPLLELCRELEPSFSQTSPGQVVQKGIRR